MSDIARNYVKDLDNERVTPAEKSLLFFIADYHNVSKGYAFPSQKTLAEDTGRDVRDVRRLIERCVGLGILSYDSGLGRGNKSVFRFLELEAEDPEPTAGRKEGKREGSKGGRKEGKKGGRKEGRNECAIRSEPEPEPEPGTKNQHAYGALNVWRTVKEHLRTVLSAQEWNLWVRPTLLLRPMGYHLLLAMPPNRAIIEAAVNRKPILKAKLAEQGYSFGFTSYPDDFERELLEKKFNWYLPVKRKPQIGAAA